jgi:hypothetical protein
VIVTTEGRSADDDLLLRVMDLWPLGYGAATNFGFLAQGGSSRYGAGSFMYQGLLGAPAIVWGPEGILIRHVGGGADVGGQVNDLQFPLHHDPSLWQEPRRCLRFRCEYELNRTVNVAGPLCHGFTAQFTRLAAFVNTIGFELKSESGVNGGEHTLFARLAQGGALLNLGSTFVPAVGRVRWRWDLTDGPVKTLVISANEEVVATVVGQLNFPAYAGYVVGEQYAKPHWVTGPGSAGTNDYVTRFLYEVRKGGGWDA